MADVNDLRIEHPTRVPRGRRGVPVVMALLLAVFTGVGGYFLRVYTAPQHGTEPGQRQSGNPDTSDQRTLRPGLGRPKVGFSAGGYIEVIPPGPTLVAAMVAGRVKSIHAIEGQAVEKGDVVAVLDDALFQLELSIKETAVAVAGKQLSRLEAGFRREEIDQARADLEKTDARVQQAETDLGRKSELLRIGAVPKKEVDAAKAEVAAAQAERAARKAQLARRTSGYRKEDIEVARAQLAVAEAELRRTRWQLEACEIKAPHHGVVLEQFARVGEWVAPVDDPGRSGAVLSIVDPKRIQAWVDVNQRDIGRVFLGQRALLTTDARPDQQIPGRVTRLLPKANLQKNTVQVKVEIPEPTGELRPEMSVKVIFLSKHEETSDKESPHDE